MIVRQRAGGGQSAVPLLYTRSPLPSEVRMSNNARPLHRMEKTQRRCWEVGGEDRQHVVRHMYALDQMPLLRSHRKGSLFSFIFSVAVFTSVQPI